MLHRYIRFVLLTGVLAGLVACGSGRLDDDQSDTDVRDFGVDGDGIAFIGADLCVGCHTIHPIGNEQVAAFLGSKHVVHSLGINAGSPASCLRCHDPIGDGSTLERFIDPAQVPPAGLAAVGCENCHGAGGEHYGVAPMPIPTPDFNQCGQCHTALPPGPPAHAGGANAIFEKYTGGSHAGTIQNPSSALCGRCHTDEGFRAFIDQTAGMDGIQLAGFFRTIPAPASVSDVQCRTCHDSHSGQLRAAASGNLAGGASIPPFSQGFNLCTSCHQVFLTAAFDEASGNYQYQLDHSRVPFHGVDGNPQADGFGLLIWDTHFPSTLFGITGYGINAANENACTSCHDSHLANRL